MAASHQVVSSELQKTFENWTDLAVAVVLIGKSEALFKRIIAVHYYDSGTIHKSLKAFDELAQKSQKVDLIGILKEAITAPAENFSEVRRRINDYAWFENSDPYELLVQHTTFITLNKEEKQKLIIGLIHEYISVVCREKYDPIINEVDNLKKTTNVESPEPIRQIRNEIVHLRTEHSFKAPKEREKFLNIYEKFVRFCIKNKNWLYLPDKEVYISC